MVDRLDRNYHWLTHVDRSHQQLSTSMQNLTRDIETQLTSLRSELRDTARRRDDDLAAMARTVATLAEQLAWVEAPVPADGPLVSVVLPVFNGTDVTQRALASVRAQTYDRWECLVVDDGSDASHEARRGWVTDPRIRVLRQEHAGACVARNRALREATGDVVAYLDADNVWHPTYLARVVDALHRYPEAQWTLATQLVTGPTVTAVRDDRHDLDRLDDANFIDINAMAHRRSLLNAAPGPDGFDEEFDRLSDWELVQRLAVAAGEPVRIPAVGSIYHEDRPDRISKQVPLHPHLAHLRARGRGQPAAGLRVLLAEWHYPQVSEQYVRSDVVGLQALGAHVEAWSEDEVAVRYEPGLPVHRGELAAAIANARPHVVLAHWLQKGDAYRAVVREAGLPLAIRGHGFDYDDTLIDRLLEDAGTMVHLFPHLHDCYGKLHPRLRSLPIAFDQQRFPPATGKDRSLVVRTGVALHTKDYSRFFEVAEACPDHRFVLVLCHAYKVEHELEEIVACRDDMHAPVEILIDVEPDKAAELVAQAGVYLHTHGTTPAYGMSISIAEALGTGCYVLAPDLPGMASYLGQAGHLYRDASHAAALIQQTVRWSDDRWRERWCAAADYAHINFGAADVAARMLGQWEQVLGVEPRQ